MTKGLVIGKFMPLHNGHIKLFDFALNHCDELTIAMVVKPCDSIHATIRASWLEAYCLTAGKPVLIDIVDEPLPKTQGIVPEAARVWTEYFSTRYKGIDKIFSSEQYGHMLANAMGIEHMLYDEARMMTQISASDIRLNPEKHLGYLPPYVQAFYTNHHRLEVFKVASSGLSSKERTIRVYLPPHYDAQVDQFYPVLYMHDAQNLFDEKTSSYGGIWNVQGAVAKLQAKKDWAGLIVVGIDSAEGLYRLDEYSPWLNSEIKLNSDFSDITRDVGGLGEVYAEFVAHKLKPLIDEKYRTLKDSQATGIMGSSMGGLISLYIGAKYPSIFSKVGALSTAAWFAEEPINAYLRNSSAATQRWYLSVGTHETSNQPKDDLNLRYLNGTIRISETLKAVGVEMENLLTVIDEGAIHHESAWEIRLPEAISFLFQL